MIFYREVKWRGGTVRLAKIDNISHLLLYQVMSEINTYELDDCWNKRQRFQQIQGQKNEPNLLCNKWQLSFDPNFSCSSLTTPLCCCTRSQWCPASSSNLALDWAVSPHCEDPPTGPGASPASYWWPVPCQPGGAVENGVSGHKQSTYHNACQICGRSTSPSCHEWNQHSRLHSHMDTVCGKQHLLSHKWLSSEVATLVHLSCSKHSS